MLLIGLTGGIGSGKSTVSDALTRRGAVVIDADAITRELQQAGTEVFERIVERFGPDAVAPDGSLARSRIAEIVFNDREAKAALEAIVHPAVGIEMTSRIAASAGTDDVVILDVPLLVESGRDDLAGVIVVDTSPAVALARLVEHRGFAEQDAKARMANQASREDRLARADFVVGNNGTLDDLEHEIERCWEWIETLV